MVSSEVCKFFIVMKSCVSNFSFAACAFGVISNKSLSIQGLRDIFFSFLLSVLQFLNPFLGYLLHLTF